MGGRVGRTQSHRCAHQKQEGHNKRDARHMTVFFSPALALCFATNDTAVRRTHRKFSEKNDQGVWRGKANGKALRCRELEG